MFRQGEREYSDDTAREIDRAMRRLIDEAFARATEILTRYRAPLEAGARQLLEKETLTRDELPVLEVPSSAA